MRGEREIGLEREVIRNYQVLASQQVLVRKRMENGHRLHPKDDHAARAGEFSSESWLAALKKERNWSEALSQRGRRFTDRIK